MNPRDGPETEAPPQPDQEKTTATAVAKTLLAWTLSVLATIAAAVVLRWLGF